MSTDNNVNVTSKSRREFLAVRSFSRGSRQDAALIQILLLLPAHKRSSAAASGEKVKLLSVDGEIIEMDKAF